MKEFDIVTVGHFAIDHIVSPHFDAPKQVLGGSPTYVSLAARKLGAHVGVVSRVGYDFSDSYFKMLKGSKVDLFGVRRVKNCPTTRFVLQYINGRRRLLLKNHGPPILLDDASLAFKARVVHVAPLLDEISVEVVDELRRKADTLSLDPQGFLRKVDACGRVSSEKWANRRILEQADIVKCSLHEARKIAGAGGLSPLMKGIRDFGVQIVIVTLGGTGAAVLFDGALYRIHAVKPKELVDPTGAGDAFAGGFLAEYVHRKEPVWCTCVGSAVASFKVETVGPLFAGRKVAIYERAKALLDKCI